MRGRLASATAVWLAVAPVLACGGGGPPNILLVTLDSVRADRVGAYGAEDARTPSLDALAEEGVVFERAFASSPLSLPSHTTILTGLDPREHGVRDDGRFRAREELQTLAEQLMERGYATAAFVGAWTLHGSTGLAQGFALYEDGLPPPRDPLAFHAAKRSAREVTDLVLSWLEARERDPFFVWAHFADVHAPRRPAPPDDLDPDRYRGAMAGMDAELGRLVTGARARGGGRDTLVVAMADHGESLGEHEEWGHGILTHDTVLRVPLIVSGPGFPAGARSRAFVRTEDLAPSLLRAAGHSGVVGRSLQDAHAEDAPDTEPVWFESAAGRIRFGWAPIEGVRTQRWKLTAVPAPPVLHDLHGDPAEERDVAAEHPEVARRLTRAWAALRERAGSAGEETEAERSERIALSGHLPSPPRTRSDKDPREVVQALGWIDRVTALAGAGRVDDAIGSLEVLGSSQVARPLVLPRLGSIQLLADRPLEAADTYAELSRLTGGGYARVSTAAARLRADQPRRAAAELDALEAELGVLSPRALVVRGFARLALERAAEALVDAERVLERDPDHEAALSLASVARSAVEGEDEEIRRLENALARSARLQDSAQTRLDLADLLVHKGRDHDAAAVLDAHTEPDADLLTARAEIAARRGNAAHAVSLLESALALRPLSRHFHAQLARLYEKQGRFSEAAMLYDELLSGRPGDALLHTARASALVKAGRMGDAESALRRALELDPAAADAWYLVAVIELADGREIDAEEHLQRAVELKPDLAGAHLQLARLYHRRGDPRSAQHAELAVRASAPVGPRAPAEVKERVGDGIH